MARKGRIDLKSILADPELRRKLMVSTIQATQAREGIETTKDQADRAYYIVTEGERVAFFDLSRFGTKGRARDHRQEAFVKGIRSELRGVRFDVARRDFGAIEGSPLAFGRIGLLGHIFRESPSIEPSKGILRQGKATGDDPRWVRYWWEVEDRNAWVPFAKGGDFSRFYSDISLVLDWKPDHRDALKESGNGLPSLEHYFKPGLTWPRAASVFNVRVLPQGCVFADKGPVVFPKDSNETWYLLGILNSDMALSFGKALTSREKMGGRWEVGVVKRFPIPGISSEKQDQIGSIAKAIHDSKADWDRGNEISRSYSEPWLLRGDVIDIKSSLADRLTQLAKFEESEDLRVQDLYAALNDQVYRIYGIPDGTRKLIEETLGDRPLEIIWPQMEGKSTEQKRMEHLWRLLPYIVKRIVEADEEGILPFEGLSGKPNLMDRVYGELEALFPGHPLSQVEVDIANELKRKVKGYRPANSIREWMEDIYFQYHVSLYKNRPVFWHIASRQGKGSPAFSAFVHYHRFDKNGMAKLRGSYLREAMDTFRREAALAAKEGREEDRVEWQARLEETTDLDRKLQMIQEGYHDYRILTPWKSPEELPKGWDPDIDDGVKVNIESLQKAGVLRIAKVI